MDATRNVIIAALPDEEASQLVTAGEPVPLGRGDILLEQGEAVKEVFFPVSGVVSIVTLLEDGGSVENAVVGREGFIGVPIVLDASHLTAQVLCQIPGDAVRIEAERFLELYRELPALGRSLRRYVQARMSMVMQTVACNRMHSVEQRCARWLLQALDRAESQELALTQEFLADMLGVRRASVTDVAVRLQAEGSISYKRGKIHFVEPAKLRARACECYLVINREYARLLPMPESFATR